MFIQILLFKYFIFVEVWNIWTFIFIAKYNHFTELVKICETKQNMLTEGFNKAKE